MKSDPRSSPMALTSHERFFDESRLLSSRLNGPDDPFGQFVREHQERFAALTASIMGSNSTDTNSVASTANSSEVIVERKQSSSQAFTNNNSRSEIRPENHEVVSQQPSQPSAADLVASILNGKTIHSRSTDWIFETFQTTAKKAPTLTNLNQRETKHWNQNCD